MKLNKLRKAAMTIEFIIVVSILVLIGCLGTSYVFSEYNTLTDKANKVEDSIIVKGDGTTVGGGSDEEGPLTFTISGDAWTEGATFEYEEGMTWREWVESEYNAEGLVYESEGGDSSPMYGSLYLVVYTDDYDVIFQTWDDVIVSTTYGISG